MDIDEYLSKLEAELNDQLAQFGVSDRPAGNMFSIDNNDVTEDKKFCPECGSQMEASVKFCSECGYKFDKDEDMPPDNAPAAKKKVSISIGGKRGQRVTFYNCGTEGNKLWEDAQDVINEESDVDEFIDEVNDAGACFADIFMQPSPDGTVEVTAGDIDCTLECGLGARFDSDENGPGPHLVATDLDTSHLPEELAQKVSNVIKGFGSEPVFDDDMWELESQMASLLGAEEVIEKEGELEDNALIFAEHNALYTFSFDGEIELDANEEFDPEKLVLLSHDYDDIIFDEDGNSVFFDCVSPLIIYDHSLYLLEVNEWEVHYPGYFFKNKGEYESFCCHWP